MDACIQEDKDNRHQEMVDCAEEIFVRFDPDEVETLLGLLAARLARDSVVAPLRADEDAASASAEATEGAKGGD